MPVPATKASASQVWRQMSLRILTFMGVHTTCTRSHWQVPKVMPYGAVWRDQHSESERCDAADGAALSVSVQRLPSAFIPPRLVMYLWGLKQSALVIHKICMSRAMTAPTPLARERYPARLLQSFCRQRRSSLNQTGD